MITSRTTTALMAALAISALAGPLALAKVRPMTLAEFVQDAEFIGVVRIERVSLRIPFLMPSRATATILDSWKGKTSGTIAFRASATWICDISDAKKGEEAVIFTRDGELELAGRGRMPILYETAGVLPPSGRMSDYRLSSQRRPGQSRSISSFAASLSPTFKRQLRPWFPRT